MRIHLIAVGTRMPAWVVDAYREYAKRLPRECALHLVEIPLGKRRKSHGSAQAAEEEGRHLLASLPKDCTVIALDVLGNSWSTEALAVRLQDWLGSGRDVALLVGGPDGLSAACLARADLKWSLSALTYPHSLVRVVLAEQLYRAWTITAGHPYHRS
ncbi:MAG TPA: 23S rRNA (pseudouridine(1915)-N(3))-methyltransferase RlmH [Gammaproteobacteria bacterium]|nr:23S rRNA (pseudouridine(1915)-N(3))-methyltransferase RlmH [Gammaproteobacteria bacterium]